MFGKEDIMKNGREGLVFIIAWRRLNMAGTSAEAFCLTNIAG